MKPPADKQKPAWTETTLSNIAGKPVRRLMFIFRSKGCSWAKRPDGGCTNCGFLSMTADPDLSESDLIAQFDSVFQKSDALKGIGEVDLYNSGSFFAEEEMPENVRNYAFRRLGELSVAHLLVESRPEFIDSEKINSAREYLPNTALEVGIGLESSDKIIRESRINKGFTLKEFERAAHVLAESGASLLANILLKPLGTTESEAVEDAVKTGEYLFQLGKKLNLRIRAALQPVFVAPGTVLEKEFLAGRYSPPNLWSVVKVLKKLHPLGEIVVGMSDEGLEPKRAPTGCSKCDAELKKLLKGYNSAKNINFFDSISCECGRD
ncbi:MAG: archaeosine biosynthesis radical SAM protein RaSEA [Candidatus Riflebacteria bacterium]|nr:archaeosine biosynthesis radical SAM protein RaSEA [Candidatus Riflebacteria bacterium]